MSQSQPRLKTSAMIASIADEGQATEIPESTRAGHDVIRRIVRNNPALYPGSPARIARGRQPSESRAWSALYQHARLLQVMQQHPGWNR